MMYMVIAVSHFEGEFPTDLNTDRRKNLELLLMVKALRNINANMTIPTSMLDSNAQEIFLNLVIGIKPPTEDEGEPVKPVACVET